jgi:hypothetical protein
VILTGYGDTIWCQMEIQASGLPDLVHNQQHLNCQRILAQVIACLEDNENIIERCYWISTLEAN